ncbi:ABC transporter substrate-binding protein [Methyloligella sp. 2.7D]|uniref:ABC transporter substrate-binding protein n=1 Tax=unclassified Methyloligella TaxID=2625955 RepID=UPI00157C8BB8|nr:ABC transporter substrate-binding protein [Methyloligella sp. GL2]QKP76661.1 ABC transporter substrate-binding protein [Methyloligella sp. GL2]
MNSNFQKDCAEILSHKLKTGQISRRRFTQGLALLFGASAIGGRMPLAHAETKELVFANWGGDAVKAMAKAFGDGFAEDTGIKVKYDGSGPTEGAISAQATSGHPTWDLVDCEPFSAKTLGEKGLMQPIDYDIVDKAKIREQFLWKYAASSYFYSYLIVYDKNRFETAPTSMADFFDVEKFPGKRGMYKWGTAMWEAALLGDGVKPADLYPLDLKRAHAKIAEIKPHVASFWGNGMEGQSLLVNGDASMVLLWSNRAAMMTKEAGDDFGFTWNQGILMPGSTGIVKDNPAGSKAANDYIAFSQDAKRQAELFELLYVSPGNPEGDALVPEAERQFSPTDPKNFPLQVPLDMDWYEKHYSTALEEYLTVISS